MKKSNKFISHGTRGQELYFKKNGSMEGDLGRNALRNDGLWKDAWKIINESINAVLPEAAVIKALGQKTFENTEKFIVVAIGKAAWNMAKATNDQLGDRISRGIVLTKYGHSKGSIANFEIVEAGHPVPDENSVKGAEKVLQMVSDLTKEDQVILLLSGGGSALFEKPMEGITLKEISHITNQLLGSGADIIEINTIRKRLSAVKGGKFAALCGEGKIFSIVLSDVLGDRLDSIASGPAYPDSSTSKEALEILKKYNLQIEDPIIEIIKIETPKIVENCETVITGSVRVLCEAAAIAAKNLGYRPMILTSTLNCEAKEAGKFMASIARAIKASDDINKGDKTIGINSHYDNTVGDNGLYITPPCAVIAGGETLVKLIGSGKGGRNQELALSAAIGIKGLSDILLFSLGSDGTDGPTEAAGGIVDGSTVEKMKSAGISPEEYLNNNDSYYALKSTENLIITGPTGSNVNDVVVLLCGSSSLRLKT